MKEKGFEVTTIYWSGFSSQGDGACFEGFIGDQPLFWTSHQLGYPSLMHALDASYVYDHRVEIFSRGNHCHEHTMEINELFSMCFPATFIDLATQPLQHAAYLVLTEKCEAEWADFTGRVLKLLRDHAQDLYRQLEAEYKYQTSDEQVLESLLNSTLLDEEMKEYEDDDECEQCPLSEESPACADAHAA